MLQKLKREWKTFAWGILSIALAAWEAGASALDYGSVVPEKYRPLVMLGIPLGFFILRQWKDQRGNT